MKNQEYWRRLLAARNRHVAVSFRWCKGHAATRENNRADVLAGEARRRAERRADPDLADRLRGISDAFFAQADQR